MTTKEKIKQYIDNKSISKNRFYTITGFSTSFLDSGNTIGVDKAKIIIEKFPDLSLEWLVMDRGPMIKQDMPINDGLINFLREKDKRIEELLQENIRLKIELSQARQLPKEPLVMPAGHSVTPPRISTSKPMK